MNGHAIVTVWKGRMQSEKCKVKNANCKLRNAGRDVRRAPPSAICHLTSAI
jgi:hypothetical protein